MNNNKKYSLKIKTVVLFLVFTFLFSNFVFVKNTNALFGVGDITFNTTIGDIPAYIGKIAVQISKVFLEKYRKKLVTMYTNDIINYVQNDTKPRFVKNFRKDLTDAAQQTAGEIINDTLMKEGVNICSPFKASLSILVTRAQLSQETQNTTCSLSDMGRNLEAFADNFNNGGWEAWIQMHEESNNLPDIYSNLSKTIRDQKGNTVAAVATELSTSGGFLGEKVCNESIYNPLVGKWTGEAMPMETIRPLVDSSTYKGDFDAWFNSTSPAGRPSSDKVLPGMTVSDPGTTGYTWSFLFRPAPGQATKYNYKEHGYPNGIEKDKLFTALGETCTNEEIKTPGKLIADNLSNTLQKTGIDNIINAQELTQFLNSLIDAATNRVVREGLSHVKTGKGAFTKPQSGGSYSTQGNIQEIQGLQGNNAIVLLNKIISFRTSLAKLTGDIKKLAGKENNLAKFKQRLAEISTLIGKNLRGGSNDTALPDVMDRLYLMRSFVDGSSQQKNYVDYPFADKVDFNKEENNPGVYLANQAFHEAMAKKWGELEQVFIDLGSATSAASANRGLNGNKCEVPDIGFTLEPKETDLPFVDGEGMTVQWSSDSHNYISNIKNNLAKSPIQIADWRNNYPSRALLEISIQKNSNEQLAKVYDTLISSSNDLIKSLEEDRKYADEITPSISKYSSLLMDYDRASQGKDANGTDIKLLEKIKNYTDALASKYKDKVDLAIAQGVMGDPSITKVTDEMALTIAIKQLLTAQDKTLEIWINSQTDAEKKVLATQARKIIADSQSLIIPEELKEIAEAQIGVSPARALAQTMNLDIDQISSELEEREAKINQRKTDIADKLGQFESSPDGRQKVGIEGGDSAWEQYFKNRFQHAYINFIYDYFKNYFGCL